MPLLRGGRPLKRWRYAGVYGPDLMLCAAVVRIGPLPQCFWAVWDPREGRLRQATRFARRAVRVDDDRLTIRDGEVEVDLRFDPATPVEVVSPHGAEYIWTRKRGGVRAQGTVRLAGAAHRLDARAMLDDSAGYHARETAWRWSAGVGESTDGRAVAWNLVEGVHDGPEVSERTVWIDGQPHEAGPTRFAPDLTAIHGPAGETLAFTAQAQRSRDDNLLVFRSSYTQPFGTFAGTLPGGVVLAEGYGVMERHDVRW
jgi:hypothetical protein